ncbi:TonB-dependent receptor plug domain-containing protein [Sphingomonas xinjiangensis]|uniref:Outer membrane receptor protein involved in Fe transport n=1 Tax=Sphingomonas xinjiangensis TaxID=643568 RepID=A0A840YR89_9SPHN|nr:TonB-dependent receptor [Sphingomonas xinjiangensis]MBB5711343.1 outer membrane receptor protein involved in Fe transport [Sphingomonas xinjiangensis]
MIKSFRTTLKMGAAPLVLSAALLASPAFAQDAADQSTNSQPTTTEAPVTPAEGLDVSAQAGGTEASAPEGEIVVTGSRIPQPNLTSVSPVTVINNEEFKLSGTTRVEDLLNTLPQVFADQGGQVSNAATGTSTVNLRNLGSQRTLVLINGRRLVPGDPSDSAADINFIPANLLKRVDVLTGGASSTYGADAVGGVVNFIMDTEFTGFRIDSQYSLYQHKNDARSGVRDALNARGFGYPDGVVVDGGTIDATATIGAAFDDNRGHVVAYAGYRRINAVTQARRDYSACSLNSTAAGALSCGGSATSANGTFFAYSGGALSDVDETGASTPYANGASNTFQIGPNRTLIPGSTAYNFGPTNYYQRPDERYTAGNFGNTFSINCDNPLLSAQQRGIICATGNLVAPTVTENPDVPGSFFLTAPPYSATGTVSSLTYNYQNFFNNPAVGAAAFSPFNFIDPATGLTYNRGSAQILRRNVEGAPRQDDLQHTSFRLVAGAKGDLGSAFTYDAYYQFARTNYSETYLNDFSISRLGRALDVVSVNGVATCRSVVDGSDPNCIPYDIFGTGTVSQASVNYLATPGFQRGQVEEQVASASFTGQLGKYGIQSPWANDGLGVAVGAEYRKESLNLDTDVAFQTGDLAGQGAASLPVNGSFSVYEAFGEARLPIAQQSWVYDFSVEGGYRYSSYEVGARTFSTDTYKVGADFAPVRALRIRGAYNRAVRSPNIQEFFAPQRIALNGSTDPCADRVLTAADAGCLAQGLSVGQRVASNPSAQYNGLIGGNPNLTPETANTYTAGVVLQPTFLPFFRNLAITVDYFNIQVENVVQGIGQDTILADCTANAASPYCALINRDASGSLWRSPAGFVTDTDQNIGSLQTSGIDIGASFSQAIGGLGQIALNFNGTWLNKFETDNGVSEPYDCAGLFGNICGTPAPEWRHKARMTFTLPDGIGISGQWRYFGPVGLDAASGQSSLAGTVSEFNRRIGSQSYFDLNMTANVGDHYTFRLGVQNLLDRDPPLISSSACPAGFCNGNTFPVVYDALGRYLYAGITLDF